KSLNKNKAETKSAQLLWLYSYYLQDAVVWRNSVDFSQLRVSHAQLIRHFLTLALQARFPTSNNSQLFEQSITVEWILMR
ncbi:hypothetical protein, partial [Streptococcus gallolyticus]|uniref:hypothetical protein n=1 Tax=Streptococcus gallolyticus TaxID=315405 RepID=UPI001C434D34